MFPPGFFIAYMYRSIIYLFFGVLLAGCSIGRLTKMGVYSELPPTEYLSYVNDSSVNIIDVRTVSEYEKTHISGAVNVNYFGGHFMDDLATLDLDTNKVTLIYCETQHRSLFVAKKVYAMGFRSIIDLDKGMIRWRKKGFPFVGDTLQN